MDRVGLVGISWRQGPQTLAQFARPVDEHPQVLQDLIGKVGARETFYLSTCNRLEVGFVADSSAELRAFRPRIFELLAGRAPQPGEAERTFSAWAGEGAAEHLFLVAAGLDSAQVGETEISGQLRGALISAGVPATEVVIDEDPWPAD